MSSELITKAELRRLKKASVIPGVIFCILALFAFNESPVYKISSFSFGPKQIEASSISELSEDDLDRLAPDLFVLKESDTFRSYLSCGQEGSYIVEQMADEIILSSVPWRHSGPSEEFTRCSKILMSDASGVYSHSVLVPRYEFEYAKSHYGMFKSWYSESDQDAFRRLRDLVPSDPWTKVHTDFASWSVCDVDRGETLFLKPGGILVVTREPISGTDSHKEKRELQDACVSLKEARGHSKG